MKKNYAVVTVTIGDEYKEIAGLTHPTIKAYADKLECDFIVIDKGGDSSGHWAKFQLHRLLGEYDRIIYVDTDVIIRNDTPDLFKIVPDEKLGIFEEGIYMPRAEYMRAGMNIYNMHFDWKGVYYNTGVMVLSRKHRYMFREPSDKVKKPEAFYTKGMMYTFLGEQTYLNIVMQQNFDVKKDFFILPYKYNRMTLMDTLTGENRLASYIIHYAGCPLHELMLETIEKDKKQWNKDSPVYGYKKNIVISVGGGLGDQICCEPVARYIIKQMYQNDNIFITTHFPTIFKHLETPTFLPDHKFDFSEGPYLVLNAYTDDDNPIAKIINSAFINVTDLSSMLACGKMIPDKDKHIHLSPSIDGLAEVMNMISDREAQQLILVHPGKGYDAKTFPVEWWNKIITGLVDKGLKVGIIGKYVSNKQGSLNIDIPDCVIDFRDALSLDGLMVLIGMARILISNDSSPVHIAGAYDNWIILIPTMKHPDNVLPYRFGYKYYKAIAMFKKLTVNNLNEEIRKIDSIVGNIYDYLPEYSEIVNTVQKIVDGNYKWENIKENNSSNYGD